MKVKSLRDLNKLKSEGEKLLRPKNIRIQVGTAPCGLSKGAKGVIEKLKDELSKQSVDATVIPVGCIGICYKEPIVEVTVPGKPKLTYGNITPDDVPSLVKAIAKGKALKKHALYRTNEEDLIVNGKTFKYASKTPPDYKTIPTLKAFKFFHPQLRVTLRNAGLINPESIEEYIARGGYAALNKALTKLTPADTIGVVIKSDLRGRGGGGFPTGLKWKTCREAKGRDKYVLCNCSEGDPGIGMHKSLIESDPHSILEGLIIGGYAIGAREGYIYLHHGNSSAKDKLQKAIDQANECGLLGKNIFGSGFNFSITLKEGAGGYVCGESTALMASLEGRAGEPRPKYIHTAEKGLWDSPTNLNNVETWCNVPPIISRGANWYSKIGTNGSKGTKVISLSGNINKSCLVEVPMGTTLKEIINNLGGGVPKGSKLKAVQVGGPPAGILPATLTNLTIDFDDLYKAGSLLGSGGMIIMDDKTCMVDIAKYFMTFLEEESCGRCTPCREGIKRMKEVLDDISIGIGKEEDLDLLQQLSDCLSKASLCDLGKSAPNMVLSTLRHFKEEYQTHIERQVCPAKRCDI
ncbi:MAG: SLBB domain-containing protein [Deltaproteobacteria bacterium]|nr:SLBB domain-containing protein [Deltaproteobacteria bacterium]